MTAKDIIVAMQTDSGWWQYKSSTIKPVGIVVHSTGSKNKTAKRYVNAPEQLGKNPNGNWFGSLKGAGGDPYALPHGVVGTDINGKAVACQILPWNAHCQGCGSGRYGSYNKLSDGTGYIQFEIAEGEDTDTVYFNDAMNVAAELCAYLMSLYPDIRIENIVSHKEANARGYASGHGDPENYLTPFGKNMNWFRDKVKGYLKFNNTDSASSNAVSSAAKVVYVKLSELVGTKNASITTVFKEKGSCWSSGWHNGVDIACAANTPIYAAAEGVVVNADTQAHKDGFGNRVVIRHPDGRATVYAHMITAAAVKVGQTVRRGQLVGRVGSTGLSTGAHLHLTLLENWDKKPNIYYSGDLLDPVKTLGLGTLTYASSVNPTTSETNFKIGDIVNFSGTTHYTSSTAAHGAKCKSGAAKITNIAENAAHPYHLIHSDSGSTVYGWVNAEDIQ